MSEEDLKDRGKLEQLAARVMAEVARRHGELGQAAPSYKQDVGPRDPGATSVGESCSSFHDAPAGT